MGRFFFALSCFLFLQNSHAASVERFQSYLRTTQAARADFQQKVFDKTGKVVQESRGSFSFLRPGRFRWTYVKPPQVITWPVVPRVTSSLEARPRIKSPVVPA